ncbi:MAG: LysR substrate-binding domain-containing protein [Pseudomonadota bacterium]|nr:LysR substrate-binding domain-containing protein [Pseudomonadota bacterium]
MKQKRRRKCLHCRDLIRPDPRNLRHQRHCSKPDCRKASKRASQRRWLAKPENQDYFKGAESPTAYRAGRFSYSSGNRADRARAIGLIERRSVDHAVLDDGGVEIALAGLGIVRLPEYMCTEELHSGRFVSILAEWPEPPTENHVIYPGTRHLPLKVRCFLDQAIERLA